jgi:hypothetical protein
MATKNERIELRKEQLAEITLIAAEYKVEPLPFRTTKKGGNYPFRHISQATPWAFVIDWHWRVGWLRFHKEFIPQLERAGLVVDREATRNCSIKYNDLRKALRLCV